MKIMFERFFNVFSGIKKAAGNGYPAAFQFFEFRNFIFLPTRSISLDEFPVSLQTVPRRY
jgi:hypothetical protein